jgi:hypothetical protein
MRAAVGYRENPIPGRKQQNLLAIVAKNLSAILPKRFAPDAGRREHGLSNLPQASIFEKLLPRIDLYKFVL